MTTGNYADKGPTQRFENSSWLLTVATFLNGSRSAFFWALPRYGQILIAATLLQVAGYGVAGCARGVPTKYAAN